MFRKYTYLLESAPLWGLSRLGRHLNFQGLAEVGRVAATLGRLSLESLGQGVEKQGLVLRGEWRTVLDLSF